METAYRRRRRHDRRTTAGHVRRTATGPALAAASLVALLLAGPTAAGAQPPAFDPVPGAITLPEVIPVFPLPDVMLFPNVSRPLHIFEPRYRAMVADALAGDRLIGMVTLQPGYESEYEGRPPVFAIGCAGRITEVEELPDGRYLIVLRGLVKFRILDEDRSRPYRLAQVEALPELVDDAELAALGELRGTLEAILAAARGGAPAPAALPDEDLVNGLAQYAPIDPRERQRLLEAAGPLERARALVDLFRAPAEPPR
ncbi:MAG: LON peptidase substrate-binding domain-containing protein [Acidobacteria bacterium]|nr:LON peptidase substrate-binding domain-containing protein [Acidobacteriota bacterium]